MLVIHALILVWGCGMTKFQLSFHEIAHAINKPRMNTFLLQCRSKLSVLRKETSCILAVLSTTATAKRCTTRLPSISNTIIDGLADPSEENVLVADSRA